MGTNVEKSAVLHKDNRKCPFRISAQELTQLWSQVAFAVFQADSRTWLCYKHHLYGTAFERINDIRLHVCSEESQRLKEPAGALRFRT